MSTKKTIQQDEKTNDGFITKFKSTIRGNIQRYTMIFALLIIWIGFSLLTDNLFISSRNLSNVFLQGTHIAIIAIGMTLVLITGNIDLSAGATAAFTGAISMILMSKLGFATFPTIIITLIIGTVIGAWNGYWISKFDTPSFIVTLATSTILRGGLIGITGGSTVSGANPGFKVIGQGYISIDISVVITILIIVFYIISSIKKRKSMIEYGLSVLSNKRWIFKLIAFIVLIVLIMSIMISYKGIPIAVMLLFILAALFNFISQKTSFGRHIFAIGGNEEAAKLSGINTKRRTWTLFTIMSILASIAGIVFAARLDAATTAAGESFDLDAVASSVIGGTSMSGGKGSITGMMVGALIMASIENGMSLMNMESWMQYVVKGSILLIAVLLDVISKKNKK